MKELFRQIIHLEKKLHHPEYRKDRSFLTAILHEEFFEFGRSGFNTNKTETLHDLLQIDLNSTAIIYSEDYVVTMLKPGVILMTYQSYESSHDGQKSKITNRSSIWLEIRPTDWQLRFHQGTPATMTE